MYKVYKMSQRKFKSNLIPKRKWYCKIKQMTCLISMTIGKAIKNLKSYSVKIQQNENYI